MKTSEAKLDAPKVGIASFVGSLSASKLDRFVQAMNRLEFMGAPLEITCFRADLENVKAKIQEVNKARNELRVQRDELAGVVADMDAATVGASGRDQEFCQMRIVFLGLVSDLDRQIAEARPVKLHERKAWLKKEIQQRELLAEMAGMIRKSSMK